MLGSERAHCKALVLIGQDFIDKAGWFANRNQTDADVDGSHINTLLLPFSIATCGLSLKKCCYLYIAQPPLYKIKHGNSRFTKNERSAKHLIYELNGVYSLGSGKKHSS